ncbi:hypothetical protein [Enterobacter asburiae]|nr:hypothetical protein [Enterobacter asburiae]MBL5840892.1 hypothetical protein [Enterobacter asburiae]
MKSITCDNSIYKEAYEALLEIMSAAEKRYGVKLYLDSRVDWGKTWMDSSVYIHGDRHVVNLVCMKLIVWQHNRNIRDGILYAYPATEIK